MIVLNLLLFKDFSFTLYMNKRIILLDLLNFKEQYYSLPEVNLFIFLGPIKILLFIEPHYPRLYQSLLTKQKSFTLFPSPAYADSKLYYLR